jgi:signal transduction histidine kinase
MHIVTNLLENAVKYSPPGGGIEVRTFVEDGAVVTITDHGIGVPQAEQSQVFAKFFRASNAPSYLYRGVGVGLYLSQAFAELCHGRLTFQSVEGCGTTMRFSLPLAA